MGMLAEMNNREKRERGIVQLEWICWMDGWTERKDKKDYRDEWMDNSAGVEKKRKEMEDWIPTIDNKD